MTKIGALDATPMQSATQGGRSQCRKSGLGPHSLELIPWKIGFLTRPFERWSFYSARG